jgi:phosphoglycolate phosphatase-like HAD superfamily hydrolase
MAAIIFDFDGTIADSFDYVADFMASESGRAPLSDEEKQALRGISITTMARRMGYNWFTGTLLFFKGRRRMHKVIRDLDAFEGMPELLHKLHNEGHELFILSTNSVRNLHRFLHHHKIHKYFLEIYGGVGPFSKAPALRQVLNEHNLEASQAVYVGDELRDVESAKAIGMRAIAVTWGFASRKNLKAAQPEALADTPRQLMSILEEI